MAQLLVEELEYRFGRQRVLNGVDLEAFDGECVVLFGANGAGKSTLLYILATRYRPRAGRYQLNGVDVLEDGAGVRDNLIFVGHHTHLYGHLTPVENLGFFAALRGMEPDEATLRRAVKAVGLTRFADRPVMGFSAGMRKRAALARVLIARPPLLLLDEPYSALDAEGVDWLNGMMREYQEQGGTIVMATHDPERVASLTHRATRLKEGILIADDAGSPPC